MQFGSEGLVLAARGAVRLFRDSEFAARAVYTFFNGIYRRRGLTTLILTVIYFSLLKVTTKLLEIHGVARGSVVQASVVTFGLFVVTLLFVYVPFVFIRYHDRRRASVIREGMRIAERVAKVATGAMAEPPLGCTDEACASIVGAVRSGGNRVYMISPTFVYVVADRFHDDIGQIEDPKVKLALESAAKHAHELRNALQTFGGCVELLVPNISLPPTRATLSSRFREFGLDERLGTRLLQEAIKEINRLKKVRRVAKLATHVHLVEVVPRCRVLLTSNTAFVQAVPDGRPGIVEPIVALKRQSPTEMEYAALEACVATMSEAQRLV